MYVRSMLQYSEHKRMSFKGQLTICISDFRNNDDIYHLHVPTQNVWRGEKQESVREKDQFVPQVMWPEMKYAFAHSSLLFEYLHQYCTYLSIW
jgi:hypothetical protein